MRRAGLLIACLLLLIGSVNASQTSDVAFNYLSQQGENSLDSSHYCILGQGASISNGGGFAGADELTISAVSKSNCAFNSSAGEMTLGDMFLADAGTFALLWVKHDEAASGANYRFYADAGGYFYSYRQNSTTIASVFYDGSGKYLYPVLQPLNEYQTLILTWDGTTTKAYVNGSVKYSVASSGIHAGGMIQSFNLGGSSGTQGRNASFSRLITYNETLDAAGVSILHGELMGSDNTTWVEAVDELPVNNTVFNAGSNVGLQGYCSSNGTLTGGNAWVFYYENNTFVQRIANASGLTNATSYNWTFSTPANSWLNYSWFIECNATAEGAESTTDNSSSRYFRSRPTPTPSPSPSPAATPVSGGQGVYVGDYQLVYDARQVCLPFKICVPFTELCLTLWETCENEGVDYIAE